MVMVKVTLNYEITDRKGTRLASFWKDIEMPAAPTMELALEDDDLVWNANRSIQYSIQNDSYFFRCVDAYSDVESMRDMFMKLGWTDGAAK
jgi:hypothetical protein